MNKKIKIIAIISMIPVILCSMILGILIINESNNVVLIFHQNVVGDENLYPYAYYGMEALNNNFKQKGYKVKEFHYAFSGKWEGVNCENPFLEVLERESKIRGKLVIVFFTHGALNQGNYLLTMDTYQTDNITELKPYTSQQIIDVLNPNRRICFITFACGSGYFFKDEILPKKWIHISSSGYGDDYIKVGYNVNNPNDVIAITETLRFLLHALVLADYATTSERIVEQTFNEFNSTLWFFYDPLFDPEIYPLLFDGDLENDWSW